VWVHALRNALPPVVAYAAGVVPLVLGYTIVIELIFRFEGLGYELVESIIDHDYLLAQTIAVIFAAAVIAWSLAADVAQRWLAPQHVEPQQIEPRVAGA
jgi:ABC-type dipeptide/oligopeptide/nickel transport system permease component